MSRACITPGVIIIVNHDELSSTEFFIIRKLFCIHDFLGLKVIIIEYISKVPVIVITLTKKN